MSQKRFFNNFTAQDFSQASHDFLNLTQNEQQDVLKQLYYQARDAKVPIALGVLYHKLHDGKTFEDFYNAWLPPQEFMRPFNLGEKTYYHYSDIPLRVLNAVNMEDPTEIISVGIMWCDEKELAEEIQKVTQAKSNKIRHDNVATVADKINAKIYKVKADTNLGT